MKLPYIVQYLHVTRNNKRPETLKAKAKPLRYMPKGAPAVLTGRGGYVLKEIHELVTV
jgi:hypothetical protein